MACEFLGREYKPDKGRVMHERAFCTASGEGCLVDDPLGYVNCCRRTFLLMQKPSPPLKAERTKREGRDSSQYALL
jgi:hypothetical protein